MKRGRPKTKISTEEYTRRRLLSFFRGYLLERLFGELEDSGLVIRGPGLISVELRSQESFSDGLNWKGFAFKNPPRSEREALAFSDGVQFAIDVLGTHSFQEFLDYSMTKFGLTINVTKVLRERFIREERGQCIAKKRPVKARVNLLQLQKEMRELFPLPNDLVRKVRKPKIPRREILRLRRVIKEFDGLPYLNEVAKNMHLTRWEILQFIQEAKRQRIPIEIEKTGGREFLISD